MDTATPAAKKPAAKPNAGKPPEYTMPRLKLLDRVLVSSIVPFSNPLPGFVTEVSDRSVDVMLISSGNIVPYEDCIHIDDPHIQQDPGIINRFEYRGVFRLADSEKTAQELAGHIRSFSDRVSSMEAMLAEHSKQLVAMQRSQPKSKRGNEVVK